MANETINFSQLKYKKKTIVLITAIVLVLTLALSFLQPLKYSASTSLLVIQTGDLNLDIYSASRSAERVADSLSQLVYTSSFFYKAMDAGFDVSTAMFSQEEYKRRKEWGKTVETRVRRGTGILEVIVYHKDKYKASELANSIAYVLTLYGQEYIGTTNVEIKIVDNVLVSRYPVKPNFLLNGFLGLLLGLIISISYVLLFGQKKQIKKARKKTVGQVIEKEKVEEALEEKSQTKPDISKYAHYPEEEIGIMPKK